MIGALFALGMLPMGASAAEPEALDEEFLEYLAELDDDEDDWIWFDDDENPVTKPTTARPATPRTEKQEP